MKTAEDLLKLLLELQSQDIDLSSVELIAISDVLLQGDICTVREIISNTIIDLVYEDNNIKLFS